jgi:hypothetical protein
MLGGYSAGYEFVLDGMTIKSFFEYTSKNEARNYSRIYTFEAKLLKH